VGTLLRFRFGQLDQGIHKLIFPHRVPARDPLLFGELAEIFGGPLSKRSGGIQGSTSWESQAAAPGARTAIGIMWSAVPDVTATLEPSWQSVSASDRSRRVVTHVQAGRGRPPGRRENQRHNPLTAIEPARRDRTEGTILRRQPDRNDVALGGVLSRHAANGTEGPAKPDNLPNASISELNRRAKKTQQTGGPNWGEGNGRSYLNANRGRALLKNRPALYFFGAELIPLTVVVPMVAGAGGKIVARSRCGRRNSLSRKGFRHQSRLSARARFLSFGWLTIRLRLRYIARLNGWRFV